MLFNKHVVTMRTLESDLKYYSRTFTRYIPTTRNKMEEAEEIASWISQMPSHGIDFTHDVQEGV